MSLCYQCFQEKGSAAICPACGYDPTGDKEKYPLALKQGAILNGRYTIGRVLGQGGFGITYLALDDRKKRRIAIKEYLPPEFAGRSKGTYAVQIYSGDRQENFEYGKTLFLNEAKTLAQVQGYKHIVHVYSYFEENNTAYFTMEYVEGLPLEKYITPKGGHLSVGEAGLLLLPLMDALGRVHEKGIIHRDIAPDNIIIGKDGNAVLIDFGAARYSTGEKSKSLDVVVKHGFAPKEQYTRHGRQGPYTDVYAMAATFYYTITGRVPPDSIDRIEEDDLLSPGAIGVRMSSEAEGVLFKGLEVSYRDRYQTMAEFHRELETALTPELEKELQRREAEKTKEQVERGERKEQEKQNEIVRQDQERRARAQAEKERLDLERKEREKKEVPGSIDPGGGKNRGADAAGTKKSSGSKNLLLTVVAVVLMIGIIAASIIERGAKPAKPSAKIQQPQVTAAVPQATIAVPQGKVTDTDINVNQSALDNSDIMYQEGRKYYYGDGVEKDYNKALELFQKAAKVGNPWAMGYLGRMSQYGFAIDKDYEKAIEWYEKGAEAGDYSSMFQLGFLYYFGNSIDKNAPKSDYDKALEWFLKAAEGEYNSMFYLGLMYENGEGVTQDYVKAMEWYQRGVDSGNVNCLYKVGLLYENGLGVEQDYFKAVEYYQKGAENEYSSSAMYYLAHMYEEGKGVQKDIDKALEWYRKAANAADGGSVDAKEKLTELEG